MFESCENLIERSHFVPSHLYQGCHQQVQYLCPLFFLLSFLRCYILLYMHISFYMTTKYISFKEISGHCLATLFLTINETSLWLPSLPHHFNAEIILGGDRVHSITHGSPFPHRTFWRADGRKYSIFTHMHKHYMHNTTHAHTHTHTHTHTRGGETGCWF